MVVERVIDLVFRALDAIDAARDRIDAMVARDSQKKPPMSAKATSRKPPADFAKTPASSKSVPKASIQTPRSALKKPTAQKATKAKLEEPKPKSSLKRATVTKPLDTARSGKKIQSNRATQIIDFLKTQNLRVVDENAEVAGKKSLAWVMWALSVADQTQMQDGISVHDVSALLYHAAQIEIYPINVSRMVHDHTQYIRQASQEKRTKRYLLTDEGRKLVLELPLSELRGS
jgi:hypothetical protein